MKLMIDLFSGLGGASEAFLNDWSVLRYDSNPNFQDLPCTTICDLKNYEIKIRHQVDLLWASPPCDEFSLGFNAPQAIANRAGVEYQPDMSLVLRSLELIKQLQPSTWVLENVVGSIKWIEPILGPPRQIIGPYVLWGTFPFIDLDRDWQPESKVDVTTNRKAERSRVPFMISKQLKKAVENQQTIFDYGA